MEYRGALGATNMEQQMQTVTPRFSICIPTFNGARYIKEQLNSIIPLLNKQDEIIVLDDCSSDGTLATLKTIEFPGLQVFQNDVNNGLLKSIEKLLRLANGSYIILADQDDIWLPNRISTVVDLLESGIDFIVTDAVVVDSACNVITNSYFEKVKVSNSFLINFYSCGILGCCIAFNRKLLSSALPFPNNSLIPHDLWLYLVAKLTYSKILFSPEKCILYRRHKNTVSSAGFGSKRSFKKILLARLILGYYLILRFFRLHSQ